MAIITQKQLFGWEEVEELGDLERLWLVLKYLPDEKLVSVLEGERGRGRDDFPIRPMWNSVIGGIVFEHPSMESLRRELLRNGQLREVCGFDVLKGIGAVPSSWNYSRFLKLLMGHVEVVEEMFHVLVEKCRELLPDFGEVLMIDGKGISTHAKRVGKRVGDGRGDTDANWGRHEYRGVHADGTLWQRVKRWFGYKLHLLVDASYELPVGFDLTMASVNEMPVAHWLLDETEERHGDILKGCKYLGADRGYDDGKLVRRCWDEYEIKPVIDIRNTWQDGEESRLVEGRENVVYDYRGEVSCICMRTGERRTMAYGGFEKSRGALKYRCPARHYGIGCDSVRECSSYRGVRIGLEENRRIFTPLARSSYAWKRIYGKRTAVERVNSRLDRVFCFERHFIRGWRKMRFRCSLAFCVMLALAVGRIEEKQQGLMRSLLKAG